MGLVDQHDGISNMSFPTIHRVVTGHDADGKAVITSSAPLPTVVELKALPGTIFHEVWNTTAAPVQITNGADPTIGPISLPPPKLGTRPCMMRLTKLVMAKHLPQKKARLTR
jgi:hypothetical protein